MLSAFVKANCIFPLSNFILKRSQHPFHRLSLNQLHHLFNEYLCNPKFDSQHLNNLIDVGMALSSHKQQSAQNIKLFKTCSQILTKIQSQIDEKKQEDLSAIKLGDLICLAAKNYRHINNKYELQTLLSLYINTYSHILPFSQQLKVYEGIGNLKQNHFQFAYSFCRQKIARYLAQGSQNLSLTQFIAYMRLFGDQVTAQELKERLIDVKQKGKVIQLTQIQMETLAYLTVQIGAPSSLLKQIGIYPSLQLEEYDLPKSVCIKLELRNFQDLAPLHDLTVLQRSISKWDYDHLIWLSQFLPRQQNSLRSKIHEQLLKSQVSNISWMASYLVNFLPSQQQHRQISDWLICNLQGQHQSDICVLLQKIDCHKWEQEYETLFRKVLEMGLGQFLWETQNTVYYFGLVWKIQDQNMEYLRRYILNTYASLGTKRKDIPTSSYFYKILQVADPVKFYATL